jgi:hypothetical protein
MKIMSTESKSDTQSNDIDKAIAAAKARKAAKAGLAEGGGETTVATKATKEPKAPKAPKVVDAEKLEAKAAKDAERARAKAERDAAREVKRAAKSAEKKPAHLSKVERAASKLPDLGNATPYFSELTLNLTGPELAALSLHLQHFNRANATNAAASTKLEAGMNVRIVGGDPRYIGMEGTVAKAQRIRCYVTVEGVNKDVYLFTSDVEQLVSEDASATGTEG